jgi:hypothetical protein
MIHHIMSGIDKSTITQIIYGQLIEAVYPRVPHPEHDVLVRPKRRMFKELLRLTTFRNSDA